MTDESKGSQVVTEVVKEIEVLFIKFHRYTGGGLRKKEQRFVGSYEDALAEAEKIMKSELHAGYVIVNEFGETVLRKKQHQDDNCGPDYA